MDEHKPINIVLRYSLIFIGWASVVLGVVGIFLPLLPTTPFLLLAASCFAKSSKRFHDWLLNQPQLGPYLHLYLDGKGIPVKAKVYILIILWCTISTSAYFFVNPIPLKFLLLGIAAAVSIHIIRMPTLELPNKAGALDNQC
ncbi:MULTISPECIES: YbaN family protein [unclassified Ketobacter]|uniref:YbaN family protein n=1 Tax=unclassified Ketobacter TaxID=2639109 RepID=UPI000F13FD10|nr:MULTISPECIES: YbaN family protein [unclassified Ketobacter]RLT90016.1 MAG: DUF454 domain-containing protein [Ketobacter sp. GenoA1]RLT99027.1 MAG: DUF454 domain-containing protein [Ketobacter sp.]